MDMLWSFGLSLLIAFIFILFFASFINRYGYDFYVPYLNPAAYVAAFILSFFLLTRRLVKDLITLEEGLQIISEGNLHYRVIMHREDEIGRVASGINLMTEKLERQINKERELEKSKIDLITGVSHDLRTPLTSIIGYLDLLRTNSFQNRNEYERFVQNTYNKAIHLKKLIDDLFEYTRLTSRGIQLNLQPIDLCELIKQLTFEFEPIAKDNKATIVTDFTPHQVIQHIDSDKIARAVDQLLINALKYSIKPGLIRISTKTDERSFYISVENEGISITKEQEEKIFDRFYKVDDSRQSGGIQTGTGLGLSITKNIIELHGGTVALCHKDGIFNFQIRLPLNSKKRH
ncbi:sensor histidine kinase [Paenibacillus thalictri]|uniref:histidine kinase n=1 Tax=Paenibacillus thalictri TaxID=2527873 RepID=A0A4Q9DM60_9BACL|nr:HAMP domain-containing sensor histidine kinase [Paenibacillus thalictri]TBL76395.1 HAMP domain-containing histidine kinase [Paenibacillus thalictri]